MGRGRNRECGLPLRILFDHCSSSPRSHGGLGPCALRRNDPCDLVPRHGRDDRWLQHLPRYGGDRTLIVDLEEPAPPLEVEGARVDRVDGPRQWLRFRGSAAELTARVAARARLVDLQVAEPDIEEIVRRIYTSP